MEAKLGEGWGQEILFCNSIWKANCMQSNVHINTFIFEAVHQVIEVAVLQSLFQFFIPLGSR